LKVRYLREICNLKMILVYDIFGNLIGEYYPDGTNIRNWVYLGNHRLALIQPSQPGGPGFPGCAGLPPPPDICGLAGLENGIALNWAIIGIAPFLVWAGFNFRKRRTASALIFISGLGIIIFVMSREGKSQEAPTEAVYYYHNDHLGTPKVLTDQNGVIQWEAVMEPFGEINTFIASNANNPFRFPGQYEDDLTGLYYNHHRYYMPGLGRYNRVDLISKEFYDPEKSKFIFYYKSRYRFPYFYNIFAYPNNPIMFNDPDGLWFPWTKIGKWVYHVYKCFDMWNQVNEARDKCDKECEDWITWHQKYGGNKSESTTMMNCICQNLGQGGCDDWESSCIKMILLL